MVDRILSWFDRLLIAIPILAMPFAVFGLLTGDRPLLQIGCSVTAIVGLLGVGALVVRKLARRRGPVLSRADSSGWRGLFSRGLPSSTFERPGIPRLESFTGAARSILVGTVIGNRRSGSPFGMAERSAPPQAPAADAPQTAARKAPDDDAALNIPAFLRRQPSDGTIPRPSGTSPPNETQTHEKSAVLPLAVDSDNRYPIRLQRPAALNNAGPGTRRDARPPFPYRKSARSVEARGPDKVHFTVAAPPAAALDQTFIVDVWAHLERQRREALRRIELATRAEDAPPVIRPRGPFTVTRGTELLVRVQFARLQTAQSYETLLWDGDIANVSFAVTVPHDTAIGSCTGSVTIHWQGGARIAEIPLKLNISTEIGPVVPLVQSLRHIQKAFASYANADRNEVLARIQGMQKILPDLKVFLDVLDLRSGQDWAKRLWQVIPDNDVFYLFWSSHAKASEWVEKEWRCALNTRGEEFIDPVPLVSPVDVPPPIELSAKHFNDWVLAFRRP